MDATESVKLSVSKKPPKRRSRSSGVGILRSSKPLEDIENVVKEEKNARNRRVSFCNTVEVKEFGLSEDPEATGTSRKHRPSDPVDCLDIQISTPASKRQRRISDLKVKMGRLSIIPKLDKSLYGDDIEEDFDILTEDVDPKKEKAGNIHAPEPYLCGAEASQRGDELCCVNGRVVSSPTPVCCLPSELGEADMSLASSLSTHETCASTFIKPNKLTATCIESVNMSLTCLGTSSDDAAEAHHRHVASVGCPEPARLASQHHTSELGPVDMSLILSPVGCSDSDHKSASSLPATLPITGMHMRLTCAVPRNETRADASLSCVGPNETKADMSLTCVVPNETRIDPVTRNVCSGSGLHAGPLAEAAPHTTCLDPVDMSLISPAEHTRTVAMTKLWEGGPHREVPVVCNGYQATEESLTRARPDEMDTRGSADMDFTCMDETAHSRSMHEAMAAHGTSAVLQMPPPPVVTSSSSDLGAAPPGKAVCVQLEQAFAKQQPSHGHDTDGGAGANTDECQAPPSPRQATSAGSGIQRDFKPAPPLGGVTVNVNRSQPVSVGSCSTSTKGSLHPKGANCTMTGLFSPAIGDGTIAGGFTGQPTSVIDAGPASRVGSHVSAEVANLTFRADACKLQGRHNKEVPLCAVSQVTVGDGEASMLEEEPWTEIVAEEIIDDDQYIVSSSHIISSENISSPRAGNGDFQISSKGQAAQPCVPLATESRGMAQNVRVQESPLEPAQCLPNTQVHMGPGALDTTLQPPVITQQNVFGTYQGKPSLPRGSEPANQGRLPPPRLCPPMAEERIYAASVPSLSLKLTEGVSQPQPRTLPQEQSSCTRPAVLSVCDTVQQSASIDQALRSDPGSQLCPSSTAPRLVSHDLPPLVQPTTQNRMVAHDWLHPSSTIAQQIKLPPKQTGHSSLSQMAREQPPLFQKQPQHASLSVVHIGQPPVLQKPIKHPSVCMNQTNQPIVPLKPIEQPSEYMEQPPESLKQIEQPCVSTKQMDKPPESLKQVEQPPLSWEHLQSTLREHLSSANGHLAPPLAGTARPEQQDRGQPMSPDHRTTDSSSFALPSIHAPQSLPHQTTSVTRAPGAALLADMGNTERCNWLQSSALDYSCPLMEDSCDSPSFAVRQRAAMQHGRSSKQASREASLCLTDAEMCVDRNDALCGFDIEVFQEDLTQLHQKLLAVLRELSSRWKVERNRLMQEAILHLFLSASIYFTGVSFLREYGISTGVLSSEFSLPTISDPLSTEYLQRIPWLRKVYTEVKQLHEKTVSVIKRAPSIYPWVLVVWSENLVEVKVPSNDAMLEIQLETKVDVMQGAFSQNITDIHWGSTAALRSSSVLKPSNADDILKVIEKITKQGLFSNGVTCM